MNRKVIIVLAIFFLTVVSFAHAQKPANIPSARHSTAWRAGQSRGNFPVFPSGTSRPRLCRWEKHSS